jgi:hypothetical protein
VSRARLWLARATSGLAVLFLLASSAMKFTALEPVRESFVHLGLPMTMQTGLGVLELCCTLVYALPRTRLLGAILLTGYLGGAIVTHWRVGDPLLTHTLFPLWLGALLWTDVLLRDGTLRARILGRRA